MKRLWKVGLVIVAVLAIGGAAAGFVAAQTDGEGEPATSERPNFVGRLAENLGISQEKLEAAIQQTKLDLVDEAVADGRLTEEQAARIRARIESGEAPLFPHGPRRPHRPLGHVVGKVADFLVLTPQEVVEGLKDGQSLAQIAVANGSSAEDLSAFLLSELKSRLAEAVENGRIDQARADEILANAPERIDQMIHHEGLPKPHRFGADGGFPGGFREGGFTQPAPEGMGPVF